MPAKTRIKFDPVMENGGLTAPLRDSAVQDSVEYTSTGVSGRVRASGKASTLPSELTDMAMYVPELVMRQFVSGSPPEMPKMIKLHGSVLFADVSGFTQLTAKLQSSPLGAARGAEELNTILSQYFSILISSFHKHGGDVVSFSGDAMTVLFEAETDGDAPATKAALQDAALQSVRCAVAVLQAVDGFSLKHWEQYGLHDCTITLHAGMGVGELTALYVAGYRKGEGKVLPSVQVLGSSLERDGFAMMGEPMTQLKHAEEKAGSGECVVSPQLWDLVGKECTALKTDKEGFVFIGQMKDPKYPAVESSKREQALHAPSLRDCLRYISAYNPEPVQHRLRVEGRDRKNWLADFRVVSVMFMRIMSVSHSTKDVLGECAKCFRLMHQTLVKYQGMMARFNVDDKGTIMFAAFGPAPATHEDDAARAVRCGLDIVEKIEGIGHKVRVGITTGNVFCGSVGNEHRCEYTFYGTSVNMAARLMVNPANEGVLVDEETYTFARNYEYKYIERLPPVKVKGRTDLMPVFRPHKEAAWKQLKARGEINTPSQPPAQPSGQPGRPAETQGRAIEKRRLQGRVKALESKRAGGFVLVEGAAGMGKTAMLKDLERYSMALNIRVLKGSCSQIDESTPHYVFTHIMGQLLEDANPALLSGDRGNLGNTMGGRSKVAGATTDDIGSACSGSASSSSRIAPDGGGANKSACSAFLSTMANVSDAKQKNVKDLLSGSDASVFKDMPLIAPLLGQEPMHNRYTVRLRAEERQTKLLGLCVQILKAKCKLHGTMLLLDNVQWMDEVSWQLVRKLHRDLKELLIVAAFRTEAGPSATDAVGRVSTTANAPPPQRMTSMRTSQRHGNIKQAQITFLREVEKEENGIENFVKLKPLLEADLKDMAQKLLDAKELPPVLSTFLVKKSEGNPFYMIEIMNFLKRKGYVSKDSDRVNILNDRFEAEFQQQFESIGLQKLLLASMENLQAKNPQEKANLEQVLKSASALGESFQSRQVRDVHHNLGLQPGPSKVDANLSRLRELKQFDYNSEQLAYSFRSSIGRDVIYTSLTFENRKRLHTAAAEVIMKTPSDGKPDGKPRQFLTAFAHYRAAEDDAQQLSLLTDAAHQALTGTCWNETLDLLEQGEEWVNNYDQADAAMGEAVRKLPEGTLVLWEAMRGEALLGNQLPEQAYRTFKKAFKKGMDEAGIPLVVVEKDKGKKGIMGNMFRKKKKEEVSEIDGRVLPGLKSSLKAHTTLFRSLVEQAAEKGLEIADVLASLDKWAMGEHMRAALTAAVALPTSVERVLTQAFSVTYMSLSLRRDNPTMTGGSSPSPRASTNAVNDAKGTRAMLDQTVRAVADFVGSQGLPVSETLRASPSAGGRASQGAQRPTSAEARMYSAGDSSDARPPPSSSGVHGANGGGRPASASPSNATTSGSGSLSRVAQPGASSSARSSHSDLMTLELSNPSVLAIAHLALGLSLTVGPGPGASEAGDVLKQAVKLARDADDSRLQKICDHFGKLATGVKKF